MGDAEMSIYTTNGDKGTTNLVRTKNVSKSDDRIQLVGTIDELTSHLGLIKTMMDKAEDIHFLEDIQKNLNTIVSGVADPFNREFRTEDDQTGQLEDEMACSAARRKKISFRAAAVCQQNWISQGQLQGERSVIWQLSV